LIKHQPYIKFKPPPPTVTIKEEDKNKGEVIGIDTDLTMQKLFDALVERLDGNPTLHDGTPVGPEFLILLDHNL